MKNFTLNPENELETVTHLEIDDLKSEIETQKDQYLRLAADFENFKKHTIRDYKQKAASEKESFIRELLPVLDNLGRALTSRKTITSVQLQQGVAMTLQQLYKLLHTHGIEADEDLGELFDPHHHHAISVGYDPHQQDQIILEVIQRGYSRDGKLFRPASVVVNDLQSSQEIDDVG